MRIYGFVLLLCCFVISPAVAQNDTPTPTATPVPPPVVLTVWMPDALLSPDNTGAAAILEAQIQDFMAVEDNVVVEIRTRRINEAGGIISTMQSASRVARGALPDLTLLRRQDLMTAVRDSLVESLEARVPSQILGSVTNALRLGQIDDELFGVPYMLNLRHLVYRAQEDVDYDAWSYDAVLERNQPIVFSGGRVGGLNDAFYLQYTASGGMLTREGVLGLNASALLETLEFYEAMSEAGLVDSSILNYSSSADYLADFLAGNFNTAVFSSSEYLRMQATERTLRIAPIPTFADDSISILNGWSWALVTQDTEKQEVALRFIEWMMDANRQVEFAESVYMLPSRRENVRDALPRTVNGTLYENLLDNAILPLTESEGGTLARAVQTAFAGVINGTLTAEEATSGVEAQEP